ncbi:MAG: vitamin K epoxide reductase family protein [Candidatus Doudnabacteria bacterium]|nr:vitamin K epoxide reductase family protein [bacterium]MDZ4243715.1 vitamin K epoxide reductase family protein [Candidatus Doudnabacteria bacterium]
MKPKSKLNYKRGFVAAISLLGLGIMSYLTYIHYASAQSFCDISEKISCDVVTTSIYSEIFGVPVSVLGILYFGTILFLALTKPLARFDRFAFFLTVFVLVPSLYLSLMEIFSIKAFCVLCETSKVLMVGILLTVGSSVWQTKKLARLTMPFIIAGLIASFIVYFVQTGTVVKRDYSPLTSYLTEQGWVYYRSYTCSNCKKQEKLLGESYKLLDKVECHPKGPGGNPELCLRKGIDKTPTWLLEDDGRELKRLEGFQSIDNLIQASGYEGAFK